MFERVRHSRSRKEKKRSTLKVQRGGEFAVVGANAHGMPAGAATDPADIAIWHAGINAAGLGTPPLDLKILFTQVPVATTDTTPALIATRINTWFKFIGEQDTVALIAITHVQREFLKLILATVTPLVNGIKSYTTPAEIDALTGEDLVELVNNYEARIKDHQDVLMPILRRLMIQFEAVLNMGVGTDFNRAPIAGIPPAGTPSITNKFEAMFSDRIATFEAKVSEFKGALLSPARVTNILIRRIVDTLKLYLSKRPQLLDDLKLIKGGTAAAGGAANAAAVTDSKSNLAMMIQGRVEDCRGAVSLLTKEKLRDGWATGGPFVYFSTDDRPIDLPNALRGGGAGIAPQRNAFITAVTEEKIFRNARDDTVTVTDFWQKFFETMEEQFTPPATFATLPFAADDYVVAAGAITTIHYGQIAAKVLLAKLNNVSVESLIPPVATPPFFPNKNAVPGPNNFAGIPDAAYYTVPYKSGKTLQNLYNYVDSDIVARFVKYIEYQLEKP